MLLKRYANSTIVYFPLIDKGAIDYETTPVSFATGDVKISQDGGSFANTDNLPSHVGNGVYSLTVTATEMSAADIIIIIIDQTDPKEWEDQAIVMQTYGDASADIPFDFSDGVNVTAINPVSSDGLELRLVQGDDYMDSIGRALSWSASSWPDLTGASVEFEAWSKRDKGKSLTKAMTVTSAGGATQTVQLELTASETDQLTVGHNDWAFVIRATISTYTVTLVGNNAYLTVIDSS